MRVLVTGGAGFIGANLVHTLAGRRDMGHVVALDDLSTGNRHNIPDHEGVRLVEGSILDSALLEKECAYADAVVHLAARPSVPRSISDPVASHDANATGTLMVLEAARRTHVPHVVVASSSSVYGANPTLPKHEDLPVSPMSPYAVSKLTTEGYAQAYAHSFELPTLAFRFFNVFGPLQPAVHDYAAVVPTFIHAALEGQPLPVHGEGHQTRDFTYVGTVCAVLADAIARQVTSPGPVNLAFGGRHSLLDLIQALEDLLAHPLDVAHTEPRQGDVPHSQADQRRLRSLFPDVTPVAFVEGLSATMDWFVTGRMPVPGPGPGKSAA